MYVSPSCHSSYGLRPRFLPRLLLDVAYRYTSNMNRARYHVRPSRRDSHNTAKQFRLYEYKFCWNIRNFQLLRDTKYAVFSLIGEQMQRRSHWCSQRCNFESRLIGGGGAVAPRAASKRESLMSKHGPTLGLPLILREHLRRS